MAVKPRVVRNFWIELEVDGKKEKIATGPKNSGGGFRCAIKVRENGAVSDKELRIDGQVTSTGRLLLIVYGVGPRSLGYVFTP